MNIMMLSCIKATQLMELREHCPLTLPDKIQLRMHVAMCSGCRNYMKQTRLINELLRRNLETAAIVATDDLEANIIRKIL
jgi:predicted anti-sigma-YlaC factor YlaD